MNQKQAKELVRSRLSDKRYEHTLNVKKMAVRLAKRYGVDEDKAALAALLHDSAKEISKDEMRELMRQYPQYAEGGEERPASVWHGICAAILARTRWGVEDEAILSAIACHTAGKAGMSKLDKVVYLADMTSKERDWPGVGKLRKLEMKDLDAAMLAALNRFFVFQGWEECRVKALRLQKKLFREAGRELVRADYEKLLDAAERQGRPRLVLLMEAICATGIRVSEVKYLTVEAARRGKAEISLKGKIRTILIPNKLCRKLLKYAQKQKTASGEIFLTRSGKSLSRKQIWAEMKSLCREAGVAPSKVFPHNLRHLFARCFYQACRDVAKLADVLGHSSIETTRIYLISTGAEHARTLDRLRLIS